MTLLKESICTDPAILNHDYFGPHLCQYRQTGPPTLPLVQVIYDSKALVFLYKNFVSIFGKLTVCLSFEPAKWSNESMKNSATDSCLFWDSSDPTLASIANLVLQHFHW
ncbi:hypothetical protein Y032_0126g1337 [Ancylostoma ceylanicum]|uniref:Uncharacterized protein n=1 Tax=Ancylostoma ceylanicum TaxID=53326 RepID=A0A016T8K7_9BILA|nr:hypothetical protein Y032_0126g1337 [Ancylostoma ceylanicum]